VRSLLASVALAGAVALAGCNTDGPPSVGGKHLQPLSEKLLSEIESKNMTAESPMLVRIFKEESELEVWKEDRNGRYALLRTYPICRWSGELGPKIKEGDRQAPEGFYTITPALMNPNSSYHLAINMGYPNAFDRANGRTGAFLMIHGDCSSRGCYAMTDEQITEIYSLARESFFGGQKSFQIQAFPFRMTPLNMAKHRSSPHLAFWKMLKQGYDHFEVSRQEPKVDVCDRRYVFDAESSGKFSPADRCPAYRVPEDLVAAVRDKQRRDEGQTAELISRGTPAVPVRMGVDGGMNPTFLSAVKSHGGPGATIRTASGTIPAHVNPPAEPAREATGSTMALASAQSRPAAASRAPVQVASTAPSSGGIGSFFSNLFGGSREEAQPAPKATETRAKSTPARTAPAASKTKSEPRPAESKPAETRTAAAKPEWPAPPPPRQEASAEAPAAQQSAAASGAATSGLLSGAAPTLPSSAFDNRFGAWR
jgi:murein L,D-transpeptidase YafK